MDDQVFYQDNVVVVTKTRFIVKGQTYAMANISSVKVGIVYPNTMLPLLIIIGGAITMIMAFASDKFNITLLAIGLVVVVVGVLWFRSEKSKYTVVMTSTSGEQRLLENSDKQYIERIVEAINEAIISRG